MIHTLVVEDDALVRDMVAQRLRLEGLKISVAENGQSGILLARHLQPEVILMDLGMPVLDGWTATRILKSDPQTAHIPVIALTAYTSAAEIKKSRQAGCDAHESKPIDFADLLAKIYRLALPSST
jgi:two-component system, cell cycle response regulator DivK